MELGNKHGLTGKRYNTQMHVEDRRAMQAEWQRAGCGIIVAPVRPYTTFVVALTDVRDQFAFRMGFHKLNVRFVIHHTLPRTLNGIYRTSASILAFLGANSPLDDF